MFCFPKGPTYINFQRARPKYNYIIQSLSRPLLQQHFQSDSTLYTYKTQGTFGCNVLHKHNCDNFHFHTYGSRFRTQNTQQSALLMEGEAPIRLPSSLRPGKSKTPSSSPARAPEVNAGASQS